MRPFQTQLFSSFCPLELVLSRHLSEGATTQVMVVTDAATMAHTNRTAALNPKGPKQADGSDSGGGGGGGGGGEKTKKGGSFLCHHSFCYR